MIARRHILKLLVAAPLLALGKVHAQQPALPPILTPQQRQDLVRMYRELSVACLQWAEFYAYTPQSIGYYRGRAEGFEAAATILEGIGQ